MAYVQQWRPRHSRDCVLRATARAKASEHVRVKKWSWPTEASKTVVKRDSSTKTCDDFCTLFSAFLSNQFSLAGPMDCGFQGWKYRRVNPTRRFLWSTEKLWLWAVTAWCPRTRLPRKSPSNSSREFFSELNLRFVCGCSRHVWGYRMGNPSI